MAEVVSEVRDALTRVRSPSRSLLERGELTNWERRKVAALVRRREFLVERIVVAWEEELDYSGMDYDRDEIAALNWALELVGTIERERGQDGLRGVR